MHFEQETIYHIYNRSFQHTTIFRTDRNYLYFKRKLELLSGFCHILAYCIMPDHFHLMINISQKRNGINRFSTPANPTGMQVMSRKIGTILSSYSQGFNKEHGRTGSCFQPRTKSQSLGNYAISCFHYIHNNPVKACLVTHPKNWKYSSYHEYLKNENGMCDKIMAHQLLGIPQGNKNFNTFVDDDNPYNPDSF